MNFSRMRWAALLAAACLPLSSHSASDAEVRKVYEAVRAKFATFADYCQLSEEARRQTTVQTTMALAMARQLTDPLQAGPAAGNLLRQDCGLTPSASTDPAPLRWNTSAQALNFDSPQVAQATPDRLASLSNRLVTPPGPGPFPAVVLNHTIGGLSQHMLVQARTLLAAGYAVLVVDSYGPRGIRAGQILFPAEVAKDAYDALAYLLRQPQVVPERIFQAGYSLGALAAALLTSPEGARVFKAPARFRASVGWYGSCSVQSHASGTRLDMLSSDADRPLLMLMAELDIETPPAACFPLLEQLKAAGKEVQWHIYPGTTHGWDKAESQGHVYRSPDGRSMTYRYDAAVTQDANERMLAFFARYR